MAWGAGPEPLPRPVVSLGARDIVHDVADVVAAVELDCVARRVVDVVGRLELRGRREGLLPCAGLGVCVCWRERERERAHDP